MTLKSPHSPHFRGGTCSPIRLRSLADCSASKGLQSYNNNILNGIVIERMSCITKLVSMIISNLNSFFFSKSYFLRIQFYIYISKQL